MADFALQGGAGGQEQAKARNRPLADIRGHSPTTLFQLLIDGQATPLAATAAG